MPQQPQFFDALQKNDPEFYKSVLAVREMGYAPKSALDLKTKTLISMALDCAHGSDRGTANLAKRARALGATEEEIRETLRLVYSAAGNHVLNTSMAAFEEPSKA